ncbi:MAG: hypothetical protein Q8R01_14120 [Ramlibacter sp.]|nr:hypothetical protein [Ramlibacter sp.]
MIGHRDHQTSPSAAAPPSAAAAPSYGNWLLAGAMALTAFGWLVERRRRRLLETEKDSVLAFTAT